MKDLVKKIENIEAYQIATSEFMELLLSRKEKTIEYDYLLDLIFNLHKHSLDLLNSVKKELLEVKSNEIQTPEKS